MIGALRPVLGWANAAYGMLLFGWLIGIAVALFRLAAEKRHSAAGPNSVDADG